MNIKKHEVTVNGKEVALTLKEFELLEKMMLNKGNRPDTRPASD